LTPDELDELLNIRDQAALSPAARPFLLTLPGLILSGLGAILLLGALAVGVIALIWRRGFASLNAYQRPYAELVRLGHWSGTLRPRLSDTPFEVAGRLARQVPGAQSAIGDVTEAYVEGTYSARAPRTDPWPAWLAVRRDVVRGLFSRKLGSWFGLDTSKAAAPRGHPELLRRSWGARRPTRRD
jgi:hypothetical protein